MNENKNPLTDFDIHLFNQGCQARLFEKLGARANRQARYQGSLFRIWAP